MRLHSLFFIMVGAVASAGVQAQTQAVPPDPRLAAEHRGWIDDHARWNAQHLAAARRLEAVAAALRRHDTSFDQHGIELRAHDRRVSTDGHGSALRDQHARLRAAHAEAAASHRRLMAEVADLERTIAADLHAEKFRPGGGRKPVQGR
ncbi:MAG: hypothetical protein KGQ52_10915 [Alphaproteobacteria bacterium]|nr:hypothetical protein [Alphaproteobacteria bacterium]